MGQTHSLADVKLLAPIPRLGKILCSGINYRSDQEENPGAVLPEEPFFFAKMPSVVIGSGDSIRHPRRTTQLDYEIELAVVGCAPDDGDAGERSDELRIWLYDLARRFCARRPVQG